MRIYIERKQKKEYFWRFNMLAALILYTALYCIFDSGLMNRNLTRVFLPLSYEVKRIPPVLRHGVEFLALYGKDLLLGYELIFLLLYWFHGSVENIRKTFLLTALFEGILSVLLLRQGNGGAVLKSFLVMTAGNLTGTLAVLIHEKKLI